MCQTTPTRRSPGSPPGLTLRRTNRAPADSAQLRRGQRLRRAQRLLDRHVHGVELVIAGHLLDELARHRRGSSNTMK